MNDYMKAVTYNYPEKIPVKVGLLPATWAKYGIDLQDCFFTIPLAVQDCKRFAFSLPSANCKQPYRRFQ